MCVGSLAGVTYLHYTLLMSSNKSETAVHCCDPALSVLVMLVSRNAFHVVSALQSFAFINSFPAFHDHHTCSFPLDATNEHQMSQVPETLCKRNEESLNHNQQLTDIFSHSYPHLPSLPELLCLFPTKLCECTPSPPYWHVCKKSRRKLSVHYFHRFVFHRRDLAIFSKLRLCLLSLSFFMSQPGGGKRTRFVC